MHYDAGVIIQFGVLIITQLTWATRPSVNIWQKLRQLFNVGYSSPAAIKNAMGVHSTPVFTLACFAFSMDIKIFSQVQCTSPFRMRQNGAIQICCVSLSGLIDYEQWSIASTNNSRKLTADRADRDYQVDNRSTVIAQAASSTTSSPHSHEIGLRELIDCFSALSFLCTWFLCICVLSFVYFVCFCLYGE